MLLPDAEDNTPVHQASTGIEARMGRALERSFAKAGATLPVADLERAILQGDMRQVDQLLASWPVEDSLAPVATIWRDAFTKGGKVTAEEFQE